MAKVILSEQIGPLLLGQRQPMFEKSLTRKTFTPNPIRTPEERNALVVENLIIVKKFVSVLFRTNKKPYYTRDHAYCDAYLGFLCACEKYDPSKGFKLSTYAWKWMSRFTTAGYRRLKNIISVPPNSSLKVYQQEIDLKSHMMSIDVNHELKLEIEKALKKLSHKDADLIRFRMEGLSQRQIADMFGICHQAIQKKETRIHNKLRKHLKHLQGLFYTMEP